VARAIVMGAGPVGLTTAMLLAERGIDVTVLDRDAPPPPADLETTWETWDRRSVAQFRQVHYLQARGRHVLEANLPTVLDRLRALGAVPFNFIREYASSVATNSAPPDAFDAFDTVTTCRRPVLELAFAQAAEGTPGIELRRETVVTGLALGAEALPGVPHVTGVVTSTGETIRGDVVIDAGGRRSPTGTLLSNLGLRPPDEDVEEVGFVYNTQFYRGDGLPDVRGDVLAAVGSISVLTMPGDNGHWSVTLYHSPKDKPMRAVRDGRVFERVLRSLPLHAHWADGEKASEVISMASTANTKRRFVVGETPVATGLVPVGDAWGFTNPSLGRGIGLGLMHAADVGPVVAEHLDDPKGLADGWQQVTSANAEPWHDTTVQFDRIRGPEVEAFRQGLPDPHAPDDLLVMGFRALDSARHYDGEVLQWWGEQASCLALPMEVASRPGVFERVFEVATANPPYVTPGPDRAALEDLLTA
jgi:2-polyprenyl-6-methoxyphenol hydroxylase-like FAD-dependent oxidoreductase